MSIHYEILGEPGRDNALLARLDSGQAVTRLLFDCGEGCVSRLDFSEVQNMDALLFSHLHMDHIGGFDSYFRATYNRATKPNTLYGPPGTAAILQHRFRGFMWNLHGDQHASWSVSEIHPGSIETQRFELNEAFAIAHTEATRAFAGKVMDTATFSVEALALDHHTVSLGYIVREKPRVNIDTARLQELGLRPGAWLKELKSTVAESIVINGMTHSVAELRVKLCVASAGDSIAYFTDFLLDDAAFERAAEALRGCGTLVCDGQYRAADEELAQRHRHMTTVRAARLARQAGVGELVLFHLSERYTPEVWREMLAEARAEFPATRFPSNWKVLDT